MTADSRANTSPRKTLGLTGVTINAMALIAPGAFMWLLYQSQAAAAIGSSPADIWPGVLLALLGTLLTILSFAELARRYPEAGFRSAYHFADRLFTEQKYLRHHGLARVAKFAVAWTSHLYYWIYPGVMVAFMGILANYLFQYFGYHPTIFGKLILVAAFSAFIGFLALRGITGTTTSSVVLNTLQLIMLVVFSVMAILFRLVNPGGLPAQAWTYPNASDVLLPHSVAGLLFQASLAMILMVGFESSTALGATSANPQRDVPRGTVLALIIQGAFAYLLEYFASGFALNAHINAVASQAPIGDLALQIGNSLLGGYGTTLMLVVSFTVIVALLGATLTAMNTGVRISFAMAQDEEMPDVLGMLHEKYATPYMAVVLLGIVSAVIGAAGVLGGLPVLTGIILTSNIGAFLLYAILCGLTIATFAGDAAFGFLQHLLLPSIGLLANVGIVVAIVIIGLTAGGVITFASRLAMSLAVLWLLVSLVYSLTRRTEASP